MPRVKKKDDDDKFSMFEVIIIILISILFGVVIGYVITYNKNPMYDNKSGSNISEIVNVYTNLVNNYYGEIDQDKLSDAAIKGMINSLDDPFTNYMDSRTTKEFNSTVDGSFVGIGLTVLLEDDHYKIIDIIKNTPAEKSKLQVGDIITKIDGEDLNNDYDNLFSKILKGKVGTKVDITVLRDGKEKTYTLKRALIEIDTVHKRVIDYEGLKVGYIKIDSFSANTYKQFEKVMKKLAKEKVDSLIIDVRDNPGGHLKETREILSEFFNKKTVLYQMETSNKKVKVHASNNRVVDYKVVVLINSGSASAAEVVASCFKDNYKKSILVGETTYGKGTVQKSQTLNSGNSIKYTTEKWLTSKGKWLDQKGVKPDIEVKNTADEDNQLQEALRQIKESN